MPGLEAPPAPAPAASAPPPVAPMSPAPPPARPLAPGARERATAPPVEKGSAFKEAFADLRARANMTDPERPGLQKPNPVQRPKSEVQSPEVIDDDAAPPVEARAPEPEKKPLRARDLAAAYENTKAKYETLEREFTEFKAKAVDPAKDPERLKLSERLQSAEKRIQEYEEKLKFKDFTESAEYEEKYRTPYVDAFAEGRNTVASLKLTDADGNARQGTAADFDNIMAIHDPDEAANAIEALFGTGVKAQMVIDARRNVNNILNAARKAEANYKKNGKEMEEGRANQVKEYKARVAGTYNAEIKAGVEKYPQWFKAAEGDTKGAELLERGFHLADVAFGKPDRHPETGQFIQRSPEDKAKLDAAIRNRAGGFDHVVHLLNARDSKIKSLEAKLKAFEDSGPGPGEGGQREVKPPVSAMEGVFADMRKHARARR